MEITNAKYWRVPDSTINGVGKTHPDSSIICEIEGQYWSVPIDESNIQYIQIKKQVDDGTLTIAPSD